MDRSAIYVMLNIETTTSFRETLRNNMSHRGTEVRRGDSGPRRQRAAEKTEGRRGGRGPQGEGRGR